MTPRDTESDTGPVQVRGTVLTVRRVDAYHAMTVVAPGIAARFRPGQFIAIAVSGPGTRWLAGRRARDVLDVAGPLGRPFPVPRDPVSCLLVGGGYGSAPLFALAGKLRDRGCKVDFLLGAASGDRVFGALTARRTGRTATITTEDGSLGARGVVTDMLGQVIHEARTDVIYACGPMAMLRQVTAMARRYDLPVQVAVEEAMACGIGVCMTCVLPVIGSDGITRMVRSCVDGPVFRGEQIRWDDVGTIPFDAVGAPGWEPRSGRLPRGGPAAAGGRAGAPGAGREAGGSGPAGHRARASGSSGGPGHGH